MNNANAGKLLRILVLVVLLSLVGTVTLGAFASDLNGDLASANSADCVSIRPAAGDQACYTLDTSRPEWLGGWTMVYLPVIIKGDKP